MTDRVHLPSTLPGYHGCDRSVAQAVVAGTMDLQPSVNTYDWLGNGVYFWESDSTRGLEWADEMAGRGVINEPAVVGAVIDPGNCLNLLNRLDVSILCEAYDLLVQVSRRKGTPMPENLPVHGRSGLLLRHLDCAVINLCLTIQVDRGRPPFDTVRAAFLEGDPVYPGAGFNDRNHIQICVVNPKSIRGYFHPRA